MEGILSAKTGGCPEDCHFCSQSSQFDTPVKATPFLDTDEVLQAAEETKAAGASEFCIVLAVRGPDERTMQRILELVPLIHDRTGLNVAVSAGLLTEDQARRFAAGGVHRYNHNLETARSFFPEVVTTHRWDERWDTCRLVRDQGMELCCGALVGMGETDAQRIELLVQLQELDPTEVPLNFLNPRPGTPLGDGQPVEAWEAIRWIALFRLGLPGVILRYAGRSRGHPPRAAVDGDDLGHQRPHRGQLPDHPGPVGRCRPPDAGRPAHAGAGPDRGPLSRPGDQRILHRLRSRPGRVSRMHPGPRPSPVLPDLWPTPDRGGDPGRLPGPVPRPR